MEVMIDIETLGISPRSVVLQVGACAFDRATGEIAAPFEIAADWFAQSAEGREIDPDTLAWWRKQSPLTWAAVSRGVASAREVFTGLESYLSRFGEGEISAVWCKGASFDFPILDSFFEPYVPLWHFRAQRCFRTIARELDPEGLREPQREVSSRPHLAADDAVHQTRWLLNILGS